MIKAVIFDMDGLMINSERVTYDGYVIECGKLGLTMEEDFYKSFLGCPLPSVFQMFYDHFGPSFPMETVLKNVHQYMNDLFERDGVPVKEGLRELLKYLKERGCKTVVATSSTRDRVDKILKQTGLADYYDDSICGDEVERGKPNPDIFLKACQKVQVSPSEALVLEDSEMGIQAASSAGIPVICVPDMKYPAPQYASLASHIVESLTDVLEAFVRRELP